MIRMTLAALAVTLLLNRVPPIRPHVAYESPWQFQDMGGGRSAQRASPLATVAQQSRFLLRPGYRYPKVHVIRMPLPQWKIG